MHLASVKLLLECCVRKWINTSGGNKVVDEGEGINWFDEMD